KVAVASTTTSNTYLSGATAGPYDWTFSTAGNANYTSASATPINITISKATPTISLSTSPSSNYTYDGTGITATYSISTYHNQLTGTLDLNSVAVASTTTSNTYLSGATAGPYDWTFSTAGNANYTSASATPINITISKATP
ncbi:MAG: hypothetical protein QXZ36_07620, partial [Thermoproteota archaeon]